MQQLHCGDTVRTISRGGGVARCRLCVFTFGCQRSPVVAGWLRRRRAADTHNRGKRQSNGASAPPALAGLHGVDSGKRMFEGMRSELNPFSLFLEPDPSLCFARIKFLEKVGRQTPPAAAPRPTFVCRWRRKDNGSAFLHQPRPLQTSDQRITMCRG